MASDIDYDSSEDFSQIDEQIDLFERDQFFKDKKQSKLKVKKPSCPISIRRLKSQPTLVKRHCINDKKTAKAERKPFRYDHYPTESKFFQCDEEFQTKPTDNQVNLSLNLSKELEDEHLTSFLNFRRHFYQVNHQRIKSSLKMYSSIEISNIRLAPVNESVQNEFMKRLKEDTSYYPQLVYHGTELNNIESILRHGFPMPYRPHPTSSEAPIITLRNGQSYRPGIYCSRTADHYVMYRGATNTLLVCAALPKHDRTGKVQQSYGNILILYDTSRIIPLFLIDFKYLNSSSTNHPWYKAEEDKSETSENEVEKKPAVISRKFLRKVLASINIQERKNNQYQVRMFEPLY